MSLKKHMPPTRTAALGLMLLSLALCSTGCGNKPCPPARPMPPPVVYLQDVPEPRMRGQTNADLAAWAVELRAALRLPMRTRRRSGSGRMGVNSLQINCSDSQTPPKSMGHGGSNPPLSAIISLKIQ